MNYYILVKVNNKRKIKFLSLRIQTFDFNLSEILLSYHPSFLDM